MKISFLFYTTKNLSNLSNGEKLLDILSSYGLIIDKAGPHEPIREEFVESNLPNAWKGLGQEGQLSTCDFLFKGKYEVKFSGMVTWSINMNPKTWAFMEYPYG